MDVATVARIVYVVDDRDGPVERFGFAYGTLPRHFESGEERFLIEWDRGDNRVWYEVHMFCPPGPLGCTGLATPWCGALQRKFGTLTKEAMLDAVAARQATQVLPRYNAGDRGVGQAFLSAKR